MASPIATTRSLPSTTSSRQAASVRPLRTSSPMASKSPWTPASKFSLNSTVLTVEPDETEPTAKLPAVSASRPMSPPWMTPCPSSNSAPKRQPHACHAVLAIAECHAQVAADRGRLEELFESLEMRGRGTFRRFTHPLVADTFGQRNRHQLGFIAGSRTRPCSGFLASSPRKDVSLP